MPAFTTIAAAAGLAATAATTAGSFTQAKRQRDAMLKAQAEADKAMTEARNKLNVNFYEALSIPKEGYAQQVQANLVAGAQALEAGREGENRGATALAGLVQAQQNEAQNKIRAEMGQDIYNLQAATAQEDSRLRDIGIQLDLGQVEGAQLAAANAQELSAQALQQGMQGVTSLAGQAASMAPLFDKNALRQNEALNTQYDQAKAASENQQSPLGKAVLDWAGVPASEMGSYQQELAKIGTFNGVDFSGVGKMKPEEFNKFMMELDPRTLRQLKNQDIFGLK